MGGRSRSRHETAISLYRVAVCFATPRSFRRCVEPETYRSLPTNVGWPTGSTLPTTWMAVSSGSMRTRISSRYVHRTRPGRAPARGTRTRVHPVRPVLVHRDPAGEGLPEAHLSRRDVQAVQHRGSGTSSSSRPVHGQAQDPSRCDLGDQPGGPCTWHRHDVPRDLPLAHVEEEQLRLPGGPLAAISGLVFGGRGGRTAGRRVQLASVRSCEAESDSPEAPRLDALVQEGWLEDDTSENRLIRPSRAPTRTPR